MNSTGSEIFRAGQKVVFTDHDSEQTRKMLSYATTWSITQNSLLIIHQTVGYPGHILVGIVAPVRHHPAWIKEDLLRMATSDEILIHGIMER